MTDLLDSIRNLRKQDPKQDHLPLTEKAPDEALADVI